MNSADNGWLDSWRLKAIAASVSAELTARFGLHEFYSQYEVEEACDARHVHENSRACALAMFVAPAVAHDLLGKYGISDPVEELRRVMASKLMFSDTAGTDTYNAPFFFHEVGGHYLGCDHHGGAFGGDSGGDSGGGGGD